MEKATSADGTTIAYDRWGQGPLVVIVGGAFNDRGTHAELAQALSRLFTVVSYDRRGRGDSGDAQPYAVEREIEDLAAVIGAAGSGSAGSSAAGGGGLGAGPTAYVHGVSSGGALVLQAAAAGAPIERLSVMEPPYSVDGEPPAQPGYLETLVELSAQGRHDEMVEFFLAGIMAPAQIDAMKQTPMWAGMAAMAPTLVYDTLCLGDEVHAVPVELLSRIEAPAMAVSSTGSFDWLQKAAAQAAAAIPSAVHQSLDGTFHEVPVAVLAPALAAFYTEEQ